MTSTDFIQIGIQVLSVLVLPLGYFIWRQGRALRDNEIRHLQETMNRMEAKLEAHLKWHLDRQ